MNSLIRTVTRSAFRQLLCQSQNYTEKRFVINRQHISTSPILNNFKIDEIKKKYLSFTCKVCNEKNSYIISKNAYERGVVIVECSKCKNNHLIADNLKFFRDKKTNIEDLLREKGEKLINRTSNTIEFVEEEKPVISK